MGTTRLLLFFMRSQLKAIPHNSNCRYGERGAAAAKPKAQIILDVLSSILATQMPCRTPSRSEALRSATAACGGSWRGDPPERCLSRQAGSVRCCLRYEVLQPLHQNDQDQHGQCKAEVVLQPAGHLEAAAGVALGQVVVKIPAPAGDAEQQVDEAAAGQQ